MSLSEVSNKENAPQDVQKPLACVFIEIDGLEILDLEVSKEMEVAKKKHHENIAKLIVQHKGYKCVLKGDKSQIVFSTAASAINFAVDLQKVSHETNWESGEMDAYYQEEEEKMDEGDYKKIWNGLRLKVGVHFAKANTIAPRKDSEVFQYAGEVVNVAQRVQDVACGGQVLATVAAVDAAGSDVKDATSRCLGLHQIPWIEEKLELTSFLPTALEGRKFPKSYLKEEEAEQSPSKKVDGLRKAVSEARDEGNTDGPSSIAEYQEQHKKDQDEIAALKKKVAELEEKLAAAEKKDEKKE